MRARRVLWVACAAQLLVVLDTSVVNVALPSIRSDLDMTPPTVSWLALAYTLGFAGLLPVGARLGDLFGAAKALRMGMLGFTVASLIAGIAQDPGLLVVARVGQGVFAAMVAPATLTLITSTYPQGPARVRAIAAWTAAGLAGGGLGNVVSGVLTQWVHWRAVFLIAVPIGLAVVAAGGRSPQRLPKRFRLNVVGAVLVTATFTAATYALTTLPNGNRFWWLGAVAALVLGAVSVLHQVHSDEPLIPRRLWGHRQVVLGNTATFLAGMSFQVAIWFFLTFLLQHRLGFTPALTGLAFLPLTVTMFAVNTWAASRVTERFGARPVTVVGAVIAAVGLFFQAVVPLEPPLAAVVIPALFIGAGAGLFNAPLTAIVTSGIGRDDAGAASGMMNTAKQFGGVIGLAVLTTATGDRTAFAVMAGLTIAAGLVVTVVDVPRHRRDTRAASIGRRLR